METPCVLVVMGVSGSGKTTVAKLLAARLHWELQEGDALHPPANVAKMAGGTPLTDADRWPWLDRIAAWIDARLAAGNSGIVTCSALKRSYRERIIGARRRVRLVFLDGDEALLAPRLAARRGHFMPPTLLQSQLATLEKPGADEHPITVHVGPPPEALADRIMAALAATTAADETRGTMNLEAEYNNSAKVPDSAAIVARWQAEAAAFRAAHPQSELGIPYGPTPRQALDLFWPGTARDGPVTMFVHGGYWQRLDRSGFSHLASGLLAHGVAVAMPSYDLCPAVSLAMLVEQVRDAAAFLARRHGGGMLAAGHSAGGHLAAMLLATDWAARGLAAPAIRTALPISGLFDLEPLTHTSVNDALGLNAAEARRLSPLFLPRPAGVLHAVVGGEEGVEYTRQTSSIAEAWGGTWEAMPGRNHFTVIEPLGDPESALVHVAMKLLSS